MLTAAVIVAVAVAAPGGELLGGEGNTAEHFAGIFGAAAGGIAAFFGGDGIIQHRYDQLGIPLQADDGKLAQRHKQTAVFRG